MSKQNQYIDFYGEKLKVGNEVIPMLEEEKIIGISGIISNIKYSERYKKHYITITDNTDNEGNVLLENVDARCYTTQARYDERENQEYVYSLIFYSERLWPITTIPLTNKINADYEIPDETCYVALAAEHLQKKGKKLSEQRWSCSSYTHSNIYYFLINSEVSHYQVVGSKDKTFRIFQNDEELKQYIKNIIEYFNSTDLTHINNDDEFEKNKSGKAFEKKLINHLNY